MNRQFIIKIVIILIVIFTSFIVLETYSCYSTIKKYYECGNGLNQEINKKYQKPFISKAVESFYKERIENNETIKKSDKNILVLGCSYAMGWGLNDNETFSARLSQDTKYNAINGGIGAHGLNTAYKIISYEYNEQQNTSKLKKEIPHIDYFIYIYMSHHLNRLYERYNPLSGEIFPYYKIYKNNKIKEINYLFSFIYCSYFINSISNIIIDKRAIKEKNTYYKFNRIIFKMNDIIKKLYPKSKFIILVVPCKFANEKYAENSAFPEWEQKKIEDMGITVINAENLINEDIKDESFYIFDKTHPNAQYWQEITPKFVEAAGIN
jgi:hypothetical protein